MARIVFGGAEAGKRTVLISIVNGISPLVWDAMMLGAMKVYARHRQALLLSPFIMQGANTPVTTDGDGSQFPGYGFRSNSLTNRSPSSSTRSVSSLKRSTG